MIVSHDNFQAIVKRLSASGAYGLDTETTGLRRQDRLFSIILADADQGYYFNFQPYLGIDPALVLERGCIEEMLPIFENASSLFFIHNAKFDLGMLSKEGIEILGSVHCTLAIERVLQNNILGHKAYSLDACAARRGLSKDSSVEKYIKKHKLITKVEIPGKNKPFEHWHFDRVPFEIISNYGEQDALLHRHIGLDQMGAIQRSDASVQENCPTRWPLCENEKKLTKVCYRIEQEGIHINRPYVERALAYTQQMAISARQSFEALTGIPFQDSPTVFKEAFTKLGLELPTTPTGRMATNKNVLDKLDNPVANKIREIRSFEKLASTYYSSFLYFADENDLIHANIRQGGTETGRFSYSDPNLQNLPKEDTEEDRAKEYLVRRSFTPVPDYCFVAIDYKQQEFRLMLDYANERSMIEAVNSGMDVHEATAILCSCSRKQAKILNFGMLYGMGKAELARKLGVTLLDANELRANFFAKLPNVHRLIQGVMLAGNKRGYIWNWFGFRNHISSPDFCYVLPNHLIQGSCAQVIRIAMVRIGEYLHQHRLYSKLLAQVHDELLFQVHPRELAHVGAWKEIMQNVYQPRNGLYLDCSVEHSWKSWAKFDMTAGAPEAN